MRQLTITGLILKTFTLITFYFWDVALSSSDNISTNNMVFRSEQIQPIPQRITNDLSDLDIFENLESRIDFMMSKYDIKGASVAVARDGKLVYAKGIGYADEEAGEPVEPRHLFRVASVSKLITATTIMKMAELELLDINDKVFGAEGILNDSIYLNYIDPRVEDITVLHLLNHSSGWNRRYGDPIGMHRLIARQMNIEWRDIRMPDIIQHVLSKRLHYNPGSSHVYSNLGYAILGEVIEAVSGESYESYVQQTILLPLGIYEMRIGKSLIEERLENEVKYYAPSRITENHQKHPMVPVAYGGNHIELLGPAGGWIASPSEILKLTVAIDTIPGITSLLSRESIRLMTDITLSHGGPIGWAGTDGRGNWWRTGTLSGTSALLMRQNDGISWAVFFNSSTYMGISLPGVTHNEVKTALDKVEDWPERDLFYHFETLPYLYPDIAELR
jgi:CubicO group peptidase (beta-lactamase class C family)